MLSRKVARPNCATDFKPRSIDVYSNHYTFKLGDKGVVHQWDAQFDPPLEKDSREVKNEIFKANRRSIITKVGLFIRTGDIMWTFRKSNLQENRLEFSEHSKYKLILKDLDKSISFHNIDTSEVDRNQVFKVINSGIKQLMKNLKYTEFGKSRKFYDLEKKQEIEKGDFILDIKSGFFTSIDLYENKVPRITIDCSSRILRVYSMWEEYLFFRDTRHMDEVEIEDTYILGKNFIAWYGNNRVYNVDAIHRKMSPESPFPDTAKAATFKEYFKKQYGVQIKDPKQFMVSSTRYFKQNVNGQVKEQSEVIFLVPELLRPCGLTDELRADRTSMQDVAKYTKLFPDTRAKRQDGLIKDINSLPANKNELGLIIDNKSNKISGKLLPFPEIRLQRPMIPDRGNFIIKNPIYDPNAHLNTWLLICNDKDVAMAADFAKKINESSRSLGIKVDPPKIVGVAADKGPNLSHEAIIKNVEKYSKAKMVMVFLPKPNADRVYKRVKTHCNQVMGIPTQFFTNWSPRFTKNIENLSVASKVLIQMLAKLKSVIWQVQLPRDVNVNGHQVMIVGADVFHRSMHESVTSVVSSTDKNFTSYYSQTSVQKRRGDDTLYGIADSVKMAARKYVKKNQHPPNIIIVYRDGVGQSQVDNVREKEVKSLLAGLEQEFNGKNVRLVYIIVTKRLSDRFFVMNNGYLCNPDGALIVDQTVVKQDQFEYFMVAQSVSAQQGTATPTNYNVIFNNSDLKANTFYELTYNQCFSYYNWSGPLKIPAVVMMANKQGLVAGLSHAKEYRDVPETLKEAPYYL